MPAGCSRSRTSPSCTSRAGSVDGRARAAAARRVVAASPGSRPVRADGRPHVVPVCFALDGDRIVSVVDDKPKRTTALRRLDNVRAHPAVSLLVDHYDDDWTQPLVGPRRRDGHRASTSGAEHESAIDLLAAKYRAVPGPASRRERSSRSPRCAWHGWSAGLTLRYRSGAAPRRAPVASCPVPPLIEGQPAHEALRRLRRGRRHRLLGRGGRVLRVPRAERRRQDVDDAHDRVRVAGHRRRAARVRPRPA